MTTTTGCTIAVTSWGAANIETYPPGTWPVFAPKTHGPATTYSARVIAGDAAFVSHAVPLVRKLQERQMGGQPVFATRRRAQALGPGRTPLWTPGGAPCVSISLAARGLRRVRLYLSPALSMGTFSAPLGVPPILLAVGAPSGAAGVVRVDFPTPLWWSEVAGLAAEVECDESAGARGPANVAYTLLNFVSQPEEFEGALVARYSM